MLLLALSLGGCIVARGGPELLDGDVVGALESVIGPTDPVSLAAHRALVLEKAEWRDDGSGAWGTVRRLGPDDERACTPAELTVYDYRGARVEERTLCPPPPAAMVP